MAALIKITIYYVPILRLPFSRFLLTRIDLFSHCENKFVCSFECSEYYSLELTSVGELAYIFI